MHFNQFKINALDLKKTLTHIRFTCWLSSQFGWLSKISTTSKKTQRLLNVSSCKCLFYVPLLDKTGLNQLKEFMHKCCSSEMKCENNQSMCASFTFMSSVTGPVESGAPCFVQSVDANLIIQTLSEPAQITCIHTQNIWLFHHIIKLNAW